MVHQLRGVLWGNTNSWVDGGVNVPSIYFVFVFFSGRWIFVRTNYSATFEFEDFWSNPLVGGKSFNHFENIINIFVCKYDTYIYIHGIPPIYVYVRTYKYTLYPHRESEGVN